MYGSLGLVALLERRCTVTLFPREFLLALSGICSQHLMEVLQSTLVATRSAEWFDLYRKFFRFGRLHG